MSFQEVLCHEIGHSLALDHTDVQAAIMFPEVLTLTAEAALAADDIAGITSLYGPANGLVSGQWLL